MGGHEEGPRSGFECQFEEVTRVYPQYGPSVRAYVADSFQPVLYPAGTLEIGNEQEVVDLADAAVPFVYRADLGGEKETGFFCPRLRGEGRIEDFIPRFLLQHVKPLLSGLQFLPELGQPAGMGEVPGSDNGYSLDACVPVQVLGNELFTRCNGIVGVDVKIADEAHCMCTITKGVNLFQSRTMASKGQAWAQTEHPVHRDCVMTAFHSPFSSVSFASAGQPSLKQIPHALHPSAST